MKKLTVVIFFTITYCLGNTVIAQKSGSEFRKLPGITEYVLMTQNTSGDPFYISKKPVTNREYITYLCWLYNVYADYPQVMLDALPVQDAGKSGLKSYGGMNLTLEFQSIVLSESQISRDYVFNPAYIDYPVIGISWDQAMNFLDWLHHRYNEYSLIRKRELGYDLNQKNTNNFNTEAYLAGQYEGIVRYLILDEKTNGVRRSRWSDPKTFFPTFRLPSRNELSLSKGSLGTAFKPYKPLEFLDFWTKAYIEIKNDTLILNLDPHRVTKTKIASPGHKLNFPPVPDEFALDQAIDRNLTDILDIYKELGQEVMEVDLNNLPVKDNLGFMQFTIVGEDKNLNPVCLKRIRYQRNIPSGEFTIFRFTMSAVK